MSAHRVLLGVLAGAPRAPLVAMLVSLGYEVTLADDSAELLEHARVREPQWVLTDHAFLDAATGDLLADLRVRFPGTPLMVLPRGTPADRRGLDPGPDAELTLPSELMGLMGLMGAVDRLLGPTRPVPATNTSPRKRPHLDPFVGQSPEIRRLAEEALKALASESPILIEGETGTGKGVLASWLHRHGPRAHEGFVDLNCAGISRELMDSELFGHEKGAFTGAVTSKPGLLEVADKGTLFLDEVGDMDLPIQAKLLKVIEEKRFRRVGETRERHTDVRIIAATHHDLHQRVQDGLFRRDLYFRICVLPMRMPALRNRIQDIPALARRILAQLAVELGRSEPVLSPAAEDALQSYPWPGNLRDLRNGLERALLSCEGGVIEREHLRFDAHGALGSRGPMETAPGPDARTRFPAGATGTLQEMERAIILRVLEEVGNNKELASKRLGIPRSTFYQKLAAMGITRR